MPDFHDPKLGLTKIYTRTGDTGTTGLVGGQRIAKDDVRIDAYGTVDELNAIVGLARTHLLDRKPGEDDLDTHAHLTALAASLLRVQHQLFNLGSILATLPPDVGPKQPRPTDADIAWLETEMDAATAQLPPLRSFVLPGGSHLNAVLHLARTVCRRAERLCVTLQRNGGCGELEVRYLNRLSDALFVWSRWAAKATGTAETLWEPNRA